MVDVKVFQLVKSRNLHNQLVSLVLVLDLEVHTKVLKVCQHIDVVKSRAMVKVLTGIDLQINE